MNIYAEIIKAQKQKKDFAILTVIRTDGAVPRHETAKMVVLLMVAALVQSVAVL